MELKKRATRWQYSPSLTGWRAFVTLSTDQQVAVQPQLLGTNADQPGLSVSLFLQQINQTHASQTPSYTRTLSHPYILNVDL